MNCMRRITVVATVLCVFLAASPGVPQELLPHDEIGNPLSGAPVLGAPLSADATTTVTRTVSDGTRTAHTASARYYRDAAGRVRVEHWTAGVDPRSVGAERHVRITVAPDPNVGVVYTLHPQTRRSRLGARYTAALTTGGGGSFGVPLSTVHFQVFLTDSWHSVDDTTTEPLGRKTVDGIEAIGTRTTTRLQPTHVGDRAVEIVTERWVSPELKIVVDSRYSNPGNGVFAEYRVSNISRAEPPEQLMIIPPDYTPGLGSSENPWISIEWPAGPAVAEGSCRLLI